MRVLGLWSVEVSMMRSRMWTGFRCWGWGRRRGREADRWGMLEGQVLVYRMDGKLDNERSRAVLYRAGVAPGCRI